MTDTMTSADAFMNEMESSSKIAQVFSSIIFFGIVCYLVFANSTKLSFIQQAAQEKRLAVCCQISTAVAAISCFLNIFQITEVDNLVLPRREGSGYTVDLARPVEWVLTCPMMQLTLVLMGGSRIPEYRRLFMPFLSAFIVGWGTLSLYVAQPWNWVCYVCGFSLFITMSTFNRQQILEHSNGTEGLFTGDSEFRKATLILMLTWLPFPIWYALSPEGLNIIENILVIQMGWMLLNVISKGTSVLYIQRAKDNYVARLKVNRLMKGAQGNLSGDGENDEKMVSASLGPCVSETMTFLGMADKSERFLRLLKDAKITSLEKVSALTPEDCKEKKLPWDLVNALQKRHRIWTLEVQDDAEDGLEKGESYYTQQNKILKGNESPPEQDLPAGFLPPPPPPQAGRGGVRDSLINFSFAEARNSGQIFPGDMAGIGPPALVESASEEVLAKLAGMEDQMERLTSIEEKLDKIDRGFQGMDRGIQSIEQKMEKKLEMKMEQGFQGVCRDIGKSTGECQQAIASGLQNISKSIERSGINLEEKVQHVFNNHDKRLQIMDEDIQSHFKNVAENLAEQTSEISQHSQTSLADLCHAVDQSLVNIRETLTANEAHLEQDLDKMIQRMSQHIMTDAKSNAFTLTTQMNAVEEAQTRYADTLGSDLKEFIKQSLDHSRDNFMGDTLHHMSEELRRFQEKQSRGVDENSENLMRCIREVNDSVEKHVQVGVGVIQNTLRVQIDDQEEMYKESQRKLSDVAEIVQATKNEEDVIEKLILQSQRTEEELFNKLEMVMKQSLNDQKYASEDLMQKLEMQLRKDITDQKQLSSSVLEQAAAAQFRTKECCEMVAELTGRIATTVPSAAATPRSGSDPSGMMSSPGMERMPSTPVPSSAVPMQRPQTAGPRRYAGM